MTTETFLYHCDHAGEQRWKLSALLGSWSGENVTTASIICQRHSMFHVIERQYFPMRKVESQFKIHIVARDESLQFSLLVIRQLSTLGS